MVKEEATGEATIKVDGLGEVGNWKTRFIEGEDGRAIVAICDGVVEEDRVELIILPNCDAVKCLGLGEQA